MADIRPFRGLRYNQALVPDLSRVVCPPYDVISPQLQQELYARSDFNFVRLELGRELPEDATGNSRYTRAAATLEDWLSRGVLEADEEPAIYLHDHYFPFRGKELRRRGMMVSVRLEEWDRMVVRPHEGTFAGPRGDRLELLWALGANTSPVLAMFEDPAGEVAEILQADARSSSPVMDLTGEDGERHVVRRITHPERVSGISASLVASPLYIADGHHRYTSALAYRRERRSCARSPGPAGQEPYDFVMMTLVDMSDPGLIILPPHRLVRGLPPPVLDGLRARLETLFEVRETPLPAYEAGRFPAEAAEPGGDTTLACMTTGSDRLLLLRLRQETDISPMMPSLHTALFQRLDVSIVDYVVLESLLEMAIAAGDPRVSYDHDAGDAVRRVQDAEYQVAFFLRPLSPKLIKTFADQGDQMPRKATYFHPKTPVGLVVHRLA